MSLTENAFTYSENPTTIGENFAQKWNIHPQRAEGFYGKAHGSKEWPLLFMDVYKSEPI
ncbi:MAG: hypothetical protein ABFS45_14680 [Pseudomonadota bacterium]